MYPHAAGHQARVENTLPRKLLARENYLKKFQDYNYSGSLTKREIKMAGCWPSKKK